MQKLKYDKHIFICANQKEGGKKCCGEAQGMELVKRFREEIKAAGIDFPVRAQKAGCLDLCAFGPAIMIYPEGTMYGNVQPEDVPEIVSSHIQNNQPVERLLIKA